MTCCWLNVLTFPMQVMAESLKAYTCIACAISVFSKQQCYLNLSFLQEHLQKKKKKEKEHLQERISHFPLPKLLLLKSQFEWEVD